MSKRRPTNDELVDALGTQRPPRPKKPRITPTNANGKGSKAAAKRAIRAQLLTDAEQRALRGLMARDREIAREFVVPLQLDFVAFRSEVEKRLKLDEGSLGTTHQLDLEALAVTES